MPRAILIFLVANLVLAAVIARGLRRSADFGVVAGEALPLRLCRYGIETIVRTIGLKGIGDGGRPTPVRIVEIFMGVVGTVLSATIFGVLTTALVGSIGGSREIALGDLPRHRVATLKDSTAQSFLEQLPADEASTVRTGDGGSRSAPRPDHAGSAVRDAGRRRLRRCRDGRLRRALCRGGILAGGDAAAGTRARWNSSSATGRSSPI